MYRFNAIWRCTTILTSNRSGIRQPGMHCCALKFGVFLVFIIYNYMRHAETCKEMHFHTVYAHFNVLCHTVSIYKYEVTAELVNCQHKVRWGK